MSSAQWPLLSMASDHVHTGTMLLHQHSDVVGFQSDHRVWYP